MVSVSNRPTGKKNKVLKRLIGPCFMMSKYRYSIFALCISNLRNVKRETYPEPELFKPERFLTPDGQLDPTVLDPQVTGAFGFGRR